MNKDKDSELTEIAELIADRVSVKWPESKVMDAKTKRVLTNLRRIDRIGSVYDAKENQSTELIPENTRPTEPLEKWGSLLVYEQIRKGGFGKVFLAYDPDLKKNVALKFEREDMVGKMGEDTFIREAQKLAKVRHANVLVVHGVARHNGKTGIWTDLIEGLTLEELLAQQGTFGAREAAHIGVELCGALAAVHRAGLIHNDVKTLNVMRETGGKYVLMDFGAATRAPSWEGADKGPHSGTPLYMAPEALQGETCNVATDVYALGVVLFRLVSQRYPTEGRSHHELIENHRAGRKVRLRDVRPELPPGFVDIVEKAVAADPDHRYRTVGEMESALLRFLSPAEGPVPAKEKPSWLERSLLIGAGVVVLAITGSRAYEVLSPFDVEASLFRVGPQAEERLTSGSRIVTGDQLFLEMKASRNMHVYVLDQDKKGQAFLLFPLAGLDEQNPLKGNRVHRLPGPMKGTPNYWDVTSAGGEELLFIVASRKPVEELEGIRRHLAEPGRSGPVEISLEEAIRVRGIGKLSPRPGPSSDPSIGEMIQGLDSRSSKQKGLWVFEFRLPNPSP